MCKGCWISEGEESRELPGNADAIIAKFNELYAMDDCSTGGPLHVELEDDNVEIPVWVPYNGPSAESGRPTPGPWFSPEVIAKAQEICDLVNPLPMPQRWGLIGKWRGHFE